MSSVKLIRPLSGLEACTGNPTRWPNLFKSIKARGFSGIEMCYPGPFYPFKGQEDALRASLKENELDLVVQIQSLDYPVKSADWKEHADDLARKVAEVKETFPVSLINVHGGNCSFSRDDLLRFYERAAQIEKDAGVPMVHETNREGCLYSPLVLRDVMTDLPESLRFKADLSYFNEVLPESLDRLLAAMKDPDYRGAGVDFLIKRTNYITARDPLRYRVPHPLCTDFCCDLEMLFHWWTKIAESMVDRGVEVRVSREFGPKPYLPYLPSINTPVAELDEICINFGPAARRLREKALNGGKEGLESETALGW